jgi:hypothetical protein
MNFGLSRAATAALLLLTACAAGDGGAPRGTGNVMGATLTGQSEVPPTSTSGRGIATVDYDRATRTLSWTVTWGGLSGPVAGAHFHGPAVPGQTAPVTLALAPGGAPPTSPLNGSSRIDDDEAADLLAGKWYVNIHTAANPGGEIRGQVMPK